MAKLIAYFSRAGYNYLNGEIKNLRVGNTKIAAELLASLTGADLFQIEPLVPYSTDYSACIEEARQDQGRDARPELRQWPESLDSYDTIYLGYPNYWGTLPMAVFTFLERYDWSGKTIKPFCTHEGSGLGESVRDLKRLCPSATLAHGLAIQGTHAKNAAPALSAWL